jgi:predicted nucleic acid-binding Zn ribbon protein
MSGAQQVCTDKCSVRLAKKKFKVKHSLLIKLIKLLLAITRY